MYLPGILLVASVWGLVLGLVTAAASTLVFAYLFLSPVGSLQLKAEDFVALGAFLIVALVACSIARLARSLEAEVEARTEADLSAELARLLLRAPDIRAALPVAAERLARTLRLPSASIELGAIDADERHVRFPLRGDGRLGTLLVPAGLTKPTLWRLKERVRPSLETLLQAARDRERVADALRASRDELRQAAGEQTALRRLATLVAHGVAAAKVLDAVAAEMGKVLGVAHTMLTCYETDGTVTCVAAWNNGDIQATMPVGSRWPLEKGTPAELIARTRAPGRLNVGEGTSETSARFRARGIYSFVCCPIMVGRCLWGVAIVASSTPELFPSGIEERMVDFADLAAAAIANAQSNAELKASRARLVIAADQTRRRIERDLHDGTQQRLVTIGLEVLAIQAKVRPGMDRPETDQLKEQLGHTARALAEAVEDLQEISRGLHPTILAKFGLSKALTALARRSAVAVDLGVDLDRRLPERLELTLYYVVSEALTNAAKHAHASFVHVGLTERDSTIRLLIHDDGIGGADPGCGSGLIGLTDRIEALDGKLTITSPPGQGTSLLAEVPGVEESRNGQ